MARTRKDKNQAPMGREDRTECPPSSGKPPSDGPAGEEPRALPLRPIPPQPLPVDLTISLHAFSALCVPFKKFITRPRSYRPGLSP